MPGSGIGPRPAARKGIALSESSLARETTINGGPLPAVFEAAVEGLTLASWGQSNVELIRRKLGTVGAVLCRGFKEPTIEEFQEFLTIVAGELFDYSYRSTPRHQVSGKIYTSTEYPAHQKIPLHNEMSYTRQWPMVLGFLCLQPAASGGETPIADSRKVLARIDPEIRNRFATHQVQYVRNYGDDLDLSWQEVFQTDDRAVVEDFCRSAGIDWEWKSEQRLRTSQVCQAVAEHPQTHEQVWFNQAHLFHVTSLAPDVRAALINSSGGELPRNTYYGDGSEIEEDDLNHVRAAYDRETVTFPWQQGDVLVVDNMLVAHARNAYQGKRTVVVGMGQLNEAST